MRKRPNKIKFRFSFMDGEATEWGIVALVAVVLIVCVT